MNRFISFITLYRNAILFLSIIIVYYFNMLVDIMLVDAAQYALISLEMSWTKSFLQVYQQGNDYLDKPPLLFWLSSLSYLTFGISNFTYKLPSVIIALLGIYSIYKFTFLWYDKKRAILAAFILSTSQALFLITNDVRTDTNLLGLVIFSVWQISAYLRTTNWSNLILASIGIGAGMMAKGPIAMVIPILAFGPHFLLKREWRNIIKPQWLILFAIVAIVLIPMSYGLYTQFDLHPEKNVYNLQGPSGLRFFYWTQSFGRITGENYWSNDYGYFYFFHTILWDLQPWVFLFIPALFLRIRKIIVQKLKALPNEEYITLSGFLLVFAALSLSGYKLPHYIFVLFPFAAVILADFIYSLSGRILQRISNIQFGVLHIFWVLMPVYFIFMFPPKTLVLPTILAVLFFVNWKVFLHYKTTNDQLFVPTIITAVSFNLLMSTAFYPNLLTYQSSTQVGRLLHEKQIPKDKFYPVNRGNYALDYYSQRINTNISPEQIDTLPAKTWLLINKGTLNKLQLVKPIAYTPIDTFPVFTVTRLKLPFLMKSTRNSAIREDYLIELK